MSALAITAALEALEAGDVALCEAILLGALEDGPSTHACACPECGLQFEWPGLRDAHLLSVHGLEEAA